MSSILEMVNAKSHKKCLKRVSLCFQLMRNVRSSFSRGVSLTRSQVVQQQLPTGEIKQMSGFSLQRHSLKQYKENRGENKLRPT